MIDDSIIAFKDEYKKWLKHQPWEQYELKPIQFVALALACVLFIAVTLYVACEFLIIFK
jgi:hypothetical protein